MIWQILSGAVRSRKIVLEAIKEAVEEEVEHEARMVRGKQQHYDEEGKRSSI